MTPKQYLDNPANEKKDRGRESADRFEPCKEEDDTVDESLSQAKQGKEPRVEHEPAAQKVN